jgi:outer membrane protein assembly factor BamD (BamD/ComL family)
MRAALVAGLLLAGCAAIGPGPGREKAPPADEARQQVDEAERLVAARQYVPAARLLENVARGTPDTAVHDRALYAMGRALVQPDNPARNYRQALAWFDRLLREHPQSPHAADARAWRTLLSAYLARTDELERLKQVDLQLERARRP